VRPRCQRSLVLRLFYDGEKTIQMLRFDYTISLSGMEPEESEQAGHDKVRGYLHGVVATVLIWGKVPNAI
jgi:hypothetical protein